MSEVAAAGEAVPRFLVDRTAGRLARWLRILGFDTEYAATCDLPTILRLARQSGRTTLTRNRKLAQRLGRDGILLASEHLNDQLRQVVELVGPEVCEPFSRCNVCNVRLARVDKRQVRGRVTDYIFRNHQDFSVCTVCGRYYWHGTHWDKMWREIRKITEVGDNESQ